MSRLEERLDACLEALREGSWSVEECLRHYQDDADQLRPLLEVASALTRAYALSPGAEYAAAARERFLILSGQEIGRAFAAEPKPEYAAAARSRYVGSARFVRRGGHPLRPPAPGFSGTAMRAFGAAMAVIVLFGAFSIYTVATAESALPGDWRYPVKLQTERVRLALAFTDGAEIDVRSDIAQEATREIERMRAQGRTIDEDHLNRLRETTDALTEVVDDSTRVDAKNQLASIAVEQEQLLENLQQADAAPGGADVLADDAKLALADTLEVSHQAALTAAAAGEPRLRFEATKRVVVFPPSTATTTPDGTTTVTPPPSATPSASPAGAPLLLCIDAEPPEATATATTERDGEEATPTATLTSTPTLAASPTATSTPTQTATAIATQEPVEGERWVDVTAGPFSARLPTADGWEVGGFDVPGCGTAPALLLITNTDNRNVFTINPRNGDMSWNFTTVEGDQGFAEMRVTRSDGVYEVNRDALLAAKPELAAVAFHVLDSIHVEDKPPVAPTATPPPTLTPETTTDATPAGSATRTVAPTRTRTIRPTPTNEP